MLMFRVMLLAMVIGVFVVRAASADDSKNEPKAEEVKKLAADVVRQRVLKFLHDQNPNLNPTFDCTVNDITTDEVWKGLHVQVVKIKSEALNNTAFMIRQNDVCTLGDSFGGQGVTSLAVADLNGDGKPLLFFAFAFGSGEHRSMIGAVDCRAKEPVQLVAPLVNYNFGHDYQVKPDGKTAVEVYAGKEKIGKLALEKKDKETVLQIRLDEKIPDEIKAKLRGKP
jgi:hypothetical protein